jgi:hypothetical protein
MNIATSADALARAAYNALLYTMKVPPWDMCLLVVEPGRVSYLTSDSYCLSWAEHPAETPANVTQGVAFKVSREHLAALEKRSRAGRGERVTLEFNLIDQAIWYRGEDPEEDLRMDDIFDDGMLDGEDTWDANILVAFREMISERETDSSARQVMVATRYLHAVGRLKKEKDQGADLWISGENDPVLVKVGPGHRLMIQPIDRERHKAALGDGATW